MAFHNETICNLQYWEKVLSHIFILYIVEKTGNAATIEAQHGTKIKLLDFIEA